MALMPAYFTTTKMSRRRVKVKTQALIAAEAEHRKFLAKHGITGKRVTPVTQEPEIAAPTRIVPEMSNTIPTGVAPKHKANTYSGEQKLIGIATMHKSNMVPVFSQKSAEEIAKMRR